jgi:hypothetical protein
MQEKGGMRKLSRESKLPTRPRPETPTNQARGKNGNNGSKSSEGNRKDVKPSNQTPGASNLAARLLYWDSYKKRKQKKKKSSRPPREALPLEIGVALLSTREGTGLERVGFGRLSANPRLPCRWGEDGRTCRFNVLDAGCLLRFHKL